MVNEKNISLSFDTTTFGRIRAAIGSVNWDRFGWVGANGEIVVTMFLNQQNDELRITVFTKTTRSPGGIISIVVDLSDFMSLDTAEYETNDRLRDYVSNVYDVVSESLRDSVPSDLHVKVQDSIPSVLHIKDSADVVGKMLGDVVVSIVVSPRPKASSTKLSFDTDFNATIKNHIAHVDWDAWRQYEKDQNLQNIIASVLWDRERTRFVVYVTENPNVGPTMFTLPFDFSHLGMLERHDLILHEAKELYGLVADTVDQYIPDDLYLIGPRDGHAAVLRGAGWFWIASKQNVLPTLKKSLDTLSFDVDLVQKQYIREILKDWWRHDGKQKVFDRHDFVYFPEAFPYFRDRDIGRAVVLDVAKDLIIGEWGLDARIEESADDIHVWRQVHGDRATKTSVQKLSFFIPRVKLNTIVVKLMDDDLLELSWLGEFSDQPHQDADTFPIPHDQEDNWFNAMAVDRQQAEHNYQLVRRVKRGELSPVLLRISAMVEQEYMDQDGRVDWELVEDYEYYEILGGLLTGDEPHDAHIRDEANVMIQKLKDTLVNRGIVVPRDVKIEWPATFATLLPRHHDNIKFGKMVPVKLSFDVGQVDQNALQDVKAILQHHYDWDELLAPSKEKNQFTTSLRNVFSLLDREMGMGGEYKFIGGYTQRAIRDILHDDYGFRLMSITTAQDDDRITIWVGTTL